MSRAVHSLVNTVLPMPVRIVLRRSAVATIPSMRHLGMQFRLAAMARNGFYPRVIFDIGAAVGEWSRMAARLWPAASLFAFEPNARHRTALDVVKADLNRFNYRLCFLGPEHRQIQYTDAGDQTSVLAGAGDQTAEMVALDDLIAAGEIPTPDFMKLDVQGYELEVLKSGERALAACQGALLEVTTIPFFDAMPLIGDVVRYMGERGFLWYDIMGALRRPSDDALVQMDVLFLRADHPLRRPAPAW